MSLEPGMCVHQWRPQQSPCRVLWLPLSSEHRGEKSFYYPLYSIQILIDAMFGKTQPFLGEK